MLKNYCILQRTRSVREKYDKKTRDRKFSKRGNNFAPITTQENNDTLDHIKILVLGGSQAKKVFAEELPIIFKKLKNSFPQ